MASETRRFGMHQNLLYDVILRQAGTLQKAILEGVMNAIDAGATECAVTLDTHSFSLEDNGHGFQSRREIEDFFEMFGTPHQEGDATYGRFRMGRGQMMAFGRNTWRSRIFEMRVDIKGSGLDYELFEHADDDFAGTRIEVDLYDPIIPSDLERIKAELQELRRLGADPGHAERRPDLEAPRGRQVDARGRGRLLRALRRTLSAAHLQSRRAGDLRLGGALRHGRHDRVEEAARGELRAERRPVDLPRLPQDLRPYPPRGRTGRQEEDAADRCRARHDGARLPRRRARGQQTRCLSGRSPTAPGGTGR